MSWEGNKGRKKKKKKIHHRKMYVHYALLRRFLGERVLSTVFITCGAGHDFHDGGFLLHRIIGILLNSWRGVTDCEALLVKHSSLFVLILSNDMYTGHMGR